MLYVMMCSLITAQALVYLCSSNDPETLRFALLTLELLAIESSDVVCAQVGIMYRNDPKFLDRQVWANSADPDQTAPRGAV